MTNDGGRSERLKAALRDNLRRRKAQMRQRSDPQPPRAAEDRPMPAGNADEPETRIEGPFSDKTPV